MSDYDEWQEESEEEEEEEGEDILKADHIPTGVRVRVRAILKFIRRRESRMFDQHQWRCNVNTY